MWLNRHAVMMTMHGLIPIDRSLVDDRTKQGLFGNSGLNTDEITAPVLNHREEMWKTPLTWMTGRQSDHTLK